MSVAKIMITNSCLDGTQVIETLDWIPIASSFSNLFHIFNRSRLLTQSDTQYAHYLRKRSYSVHFCLSVPGFNILAQVYQKFFSPKAIYIDKIKIHGKYYSLTPEMYRSDFDVAYEACTSRWYALEYGPVEFRDNYTLIKRSITTKGDAYILASERLKRDKELARLAISTSPGVFAFLPADMKYDEELAMHAILQDGGVLFMLPERYRKDKRFIYAAISVCGEPILSASPEIMNDKLFLLEVLQKQSDVMKYLPDDLKDDDRFVKEAVTLNGLVYEHVSERLKNDTKIMYCAEKQNYQVRDLFPTAYKKIV
jgi:Domain of unknown function (DUF4116)